MKKYYKVVDFHLRSACLNYNTSYSTQYKVGEYVESPQKGTKLFICETLEEAMIFKRECCCYGFIYECSAIGVTRITPAIFHTKIKDFWDTAFKFLNIKKKINIGILKNYVRLDEERFPDGALCAKKVKLIKKVESCSQ